MHRALWWASGLAVFALVVRALRNQQTARRRTIAAPANAPKARRLRLAPKRLWHARHTEPVFLLLVTITVAGFGWYLFPPADHDPPLPPILRVELPPYIFDGLEWRKLNEMDWAETRAEMTQGKDALPPHTVQVVISAAYSKTHDPLLLEKVKSAPIEARVDLPDGLEVPLCRGVTDFLAETDGPSPRTTCATEARSDDEVKQGKLHGICA